MAEADRQRIQRTITKNGTSYEADLTLSRRAEVSGRATGTAAVWAYLPSLGSSCRLTPKAPRDVAHEIIAELVAEANRTAV